MIIMMVRRILASNADMPIHGIVMASIMQEGVRTCIVNQVGERDV